MIEIPSDLQAVSRCLDGWDYEVADTAKLPAAPVVSVFMTTYQHAPYIRQALDSVLMQQVSFPYEICLGEDGSTDGTREICLEYARRYPDKIRLFLRDRANPARMRYIIRHTHNVIKILDACVGKYIAVLEGDDYWTDPEKLQKQVDFLEANPGHVLCFHRAMIFNENRGTMQPDPNERYFEEGSRATSFDFEKFYQGWYFGMQTLVFKKSAFNNAVISRYKHFRDAHLLTHLLLSGKGVCLNFFGAVYRIHGGGIFSSLSPFDEAKIGYLVYKEIHRQNRHVYFIRLKYRMFLQAYIDRLIQNGKYFRAVQKIVQLYAEDHAFSVFHSNIKSIRWGMIQKQQDKLQRRDAR